MPKKNRLARADFKTSGPAKRVHGAFFTLSVYLSGHKTQIAEVVSKKVALRAHDRNLIKRRLRAIIRVFGVQNLRSGKFIFTAKPSSKEASYQELNADIGKILKQVLLTK